MQTILFPLLIVAQDPAADPAPGPGAQVESRSVAVDADALRARIHELRMDLLLGGDAVREAEREAARFYREKQGVVEGSLDTLHVELSEKRAAYEVALDRALAAEGAAQRRAAMDGAATLRREIDEFEWQSADLARKGGDLSRLVAAVEARERDRQRLVAQLETATDIQGGLGLPLTSVGLAPEIRALEAGSPFDDQGLVDDLLARDPREARRLLFDLDPSRYWERFPLRPPTAALAEALAFPLADLPAHR